MTRLGWILVLILLGQSGAYGEPRVLRSAFIDFQPYKYKDEAGNAAGPWVELSEQLATEAGYQLEWVHLPISRVYRHLISGEIDLWPGLAGIPELDGAVLESDLTPLSLSLSAYHLKERPAINNIASLAGKQLILIGGFTYLGLLDEVLADESTLLARTPNHSSALQMLKLDRGHYLVDYDQPISELLAEDAMPDLQRSPLITVRGAFVISRQSEAAETILRDLEQAHLRLDPDGL